MPRGRKKKSEILSSDAVVESGIGPIDVHVGARIGARRKLLQLSQKELAERLGITFQQVQKYEKGVNRIGAGRLYSIATILGVGVDYFYDDVTTESYTKLPEYNQYTAKRRKCKEGNCQLFPAAIVLRFGAKYTNTGKRNVKFGMYCACEA